MVFDFNYLASKTVGYGYHYHLLVLDLAPSSSGEKIKFLGLTIGTLLLCASFNAIHPLQNPVFIASKTAQPLVRFSLIWML